MLPEQLFSDIIGSIPHRNGARTMIGLLKATVLFQDLPEDCIAHTLLPRGNLREYASGQFLFSPQQKVERLGVVVSGTVNLMHIFADGSYSLMSSLSTGKILGADLVCTGSRMAPYHAAAVSPVRVLYFPAALFLEPGRLPEALRLKILNRLLVLIANQNMQKEYRLAILARKGLRERIVTYLTMQAAKRGTDSFTIPFSREELAAFLCVNRSALSHELSQMQQEGLIVFRKNRFTLSRQLLTQ